MYESKVHVGKGVGLVVVLDATVVTAEVMCVVVG